MNGFISLNDIPLLYILMITESVIVFFDRGLRQGQVTLDGHPAQAADEQADADSQRGGQLFDRWRCGWGPRGERHILSLD